MVLYYHGQNHFYLIESIVWLWVTMSAWKVIGSGVPQGSVLGPLFFIIFINDIPQLLSTPTLTYADDTKLISVNDSLNQSLILQNSLNIIYEWSQI